MKNFFNIQKPFKLEVNDFRALTMIINVLLVMTIGFGSAWCGLTLAVGGLVKDVQNPNRHVNDFLMHGASLILNIYFLILLYRG